MSDLPNGNPNLRSNLNQRRHARDLFIATRRPPAIATAWSLILIAWIAVLLLSRAAAGDRMVGGDVGLARLVQDTDSPVAGAIADVGNLIGMYWFGALLSVPIILVLAWRRHGREAALLLAILAVRTLNNTVKGWVESPRPTRDLVHVRIHADGYGFPSGHAFGALLLFGALALIARIVLPGGTLRNYLVAGLLLLILVVGFARIYEGVHWPSDVLGGYLVGGAVLLTLVTLLHIGVPSPATPPDPDR